jgi:hypothetical protein
VPDGNSMVNASDWADKLVLKKKYRVVTRYTDAEGIYIGAGAIGSERKDPVFSFNGVSMMIPWKAIDRLEEPDVHGLG